MPSSPTTIRPEDLPDPATLVEYPDGSVSALMFHYVPEETPLKPIAIAQGYECRSLTLDNDPGADELFRRYEDDQDPAAILRDWHPVPPDGWQLGAKIESEDGPLAMFIRKAGQ